MNEIPTPPPAVPRPPGDPRPFDPATGGKTGGCQKPLLVGCGILTLLLGIAAIALVVKAKDVLAFAMGQLRAQVVTRLPLDLTDAERDHLESAFAETIAHIREGKIDPVALQDLQKKIVAAAQSGERRISRPELEELVRALDAFNSAGAGKPAEPAEPPKTTEPAEPAAAPPADGAAPPPGAAGS